jgi:hypothetical protein
MDRAKRDCSPVEGADQGASPFGNPADLEGPVALRPHLAMVFAFVADHLCIGGDPAQQVRPNG